MSVLKAKVALTVFACAVLSVRASYAIPLLVTNPSFEILPGGGLPNSCGTNCSYSSGAIPGWTVSNPSTEGQFDPGPPTNTTIFNFVPDGITVAYSNVGTISQTVAATVQLGVTYTLLVDVGVRKDLPDPGTEALVINGNTYLATGVLPTSGNWSTFTATYTGLAADVGKPITILLSSAGAQGDWDNVRLSDSTTAGAVPEPATMGLIGLGLVGLVVASRRKRS